MRVLITGGTGFVGSHTVAAVSRAGPAGPAYPASKARSEQIARRHQSAGAPVVTTYPGAVAADGLSVR